MTISLEKGYEKFKTQEEWRITLDPIAFCIFEDHEDTIIGFRNRNKIRDAYPDVYKDLKGVASLEDFIEVVGRVKLHLFTKER